MGKKATILVTACVMILIVIFFEFFVFTIPTQQTTKDPYFAAYYNEFNKTPTPTYTYSFFPPVSMYRALLIALISGGWNATSLKNRTISVELDYYAFLNSPNETGFYRLYPLTHSVIDWSPKQINETTTYQYVWTITVGARVYCVDAATAELVFKAALIPTCP